MNLLDPIWLIVPYCLGAVLFYIGFERSQEAISIRNRTEIVRLVIDAVASLIILIGLYYLIRSQVNGTTIPHTTILWFIPLAGSIVLLFHKAHARQKKQKRLRVTFMCLAAFLFLIGGIVSLNNYFSFCTTFSCGDSPVGIEKPKPYKGQSLPFEAIYRPLKNQPKVGILSKINIPSSSPNFTPRFAYVYVPPAAVKHANIPLPVLVLPQSYHGAASNWLKTMDMVTTLNNFAKAHHGLAPLTFLVDQNGTAVNDTECVDSSLGDAETYITHDVPDYIKSHYAVSGNPSQWTIDGYSAGGTCAEVSALKHSNVYGNFVNMSGTVQAEATPPSSTFPILFRNSKKVQQQYNTNRLIKSPQTPRSMRMAFVVGLDDDPAIVNGIQQQVALARREKYKVYAWYTPGGHSFTLWKQGFASTLPWVMAQTGFTR